MQKRCIEGRSGDSASYERTARYFRRQNRRNSKAITLPSILGAVTSVVVALGHGPLRRAVLQTRFPERVLQSVRKLDVAGLIVEWQLPNLKPGGGIRIGKGRARRGIALGLNPNFPLAAEVQQLAKGLAAAYGVQLQSDMLLEEAALMPRDVPGYVNHLCGSEIKTKTILAMYCHGRDVRTSTLYRTVPGHAAGGVKKVVEALDKMGVFQITDGDVRFKKSSWRSKLYKLLRAFSDSAPSFRQAVHKLAHEKVERAKHQARMFLFGKPATERALQVLARHGTVSRTKLSAEAHLFAEHSILLRLRRMGLVVHKTAKQRTQISLNVAHPIFPELWRYLLDLQGVSPADVSLTFQRSDVNFCVDELFGTKLALDVLLMLYLAGDDGIDGADMKRLSPQHSIRALVDRTWDFCALEIVVEDPIEFGMIRYRLNSGYRHIEALKNLLRRIVEVYPAYSRAYDLRERLWPERRAARERNRLRKRNSESRPL